jgi:hypothetical protein
LKSARAPSFTFYFLIAIQNRFFPEHCACDQAAILSRKLFMAQSQTSAENSFDWIGPCLTFGQEFGSELYKGVVKNQIPWPICCSISGGISVALAMRWDALLWKLAHTAKLYPFHPYLYWPYAGVYVLSPFLIWTMGKVIARRALVKQLTSVFRNAGLQTRMGRLPGFINDEKMDTHMRRLVLSSVGLPESEFKKAKPFIEAELQVFVDQIKSRVERGTIELLYAHEPLPELILFDALKSTLPLEFMVGGTRSKPLYVSLRDVPHLLVAGYTNSGKSAFLRQMLTTLTLNNPGVEFTLVDLKRGLELGVFEGLPNVRMYITPTEAIEALKYVEGQLEKRMAFLKANQCNDFDAFYRLPESKRVSTPEWPKTRPLVRHIVAIDEAAELFLASATLASKDAQVAKRLAAKIAALGRAVGIHLIIATQRPDRNAVDPLIKSNLQGRLCFQMADNASSMTILDSVRAADLPPTKGRAIWRSGFDLIEVQVPWLDRDEMGPILAPHKPAKTAESVSAENTTVTVETKSDSGEPVKDEIAILDEAMASSSPAPVVKSAEPVEVKS